MTKESELFEIAVANFLQALDKNAKVTQDVDIPDKDTGSPRQRDVWIEAKICQLFPVKIYVSCKYKNRKLNQQDMDAVIGELLSSNANKGVIFSKAGFTKPAIEKAEANNICCCKLYENQKPDLPEVLAIKQYCVKSRVLFEIKDIASKVPLSTYDELFNTQIQSISGKKIKLIDEIQNEFSNLEKHATKKENLENMFPKNWERNMRLLIDDKNGHIDIKLGIGWNIFEAKLEAFLTNGTYSFTDKAFVGSQTGPIMDVKSAHPGDSWTLLEKRPEIKGNTLVATFCGGDCKAALTNSYKGKELGNNI